MTISPLAAHLASGTPLDEVPGVVDVAEAAPPNPPGWLQEQFVGLSFEAAYAEADAFIAAVEEDLGTLGHGDLKSSRVLDFGSGWGRVSRVLLSKVAPERLFAADVDLEMTALVNTTLPGINAMTVLSSPPTVLADASMDVVVAFSVFSHLSEATHVAWARELARLVRHGGVIAITVLGEEFIDHVAGAQDAHASGRADAFAENMASIFPDIAGARAAFRADRLVFDAAGGGGVRTNDYYGWAVASRRCVERIWGGEGLRLVRWRPSGELFPQALAVLVRTRKRPWHKAALGVRHTAARQVRRAASRLPAPVQAAIRRRIRSSVS